MNGSAQPNYEIANDVKFTVNTDGTVTEVVMHDKHKPTTTTTTTTTTTATTSNPHTGMDGKVMNGAFAVMALCTAAMVIAKRRKDND